MIILILVATLLSAFFSGSETAYISARRFKLEAWARQGRRGAKSTLKLMKQPERFLTTILVGNNVAVVSASTLIAIYLEKYFSGSVIIVLSSLFLLVFGEIIPKSIARDRASVIAMLVNQPLKFAFVLFYPIIKFVIFVSGKVLSVIGMESNSVEQYFSRKDLELLLREGVESGLMDAADSELISKWLNCGRRPVREAMVPRTEIKSIENVVSRDAAMTQFEECGYSRIAVYEENIDHIVGVIHVKDLLLSKASTIPELIKKPFYMPESLAIAQCLYQMQQANVVFAVIIDEYGGTAGIVTIVDLLEEYFGEIETPGIERKWIRKVTTVHMDIDARAEIDMLNKNFNLELPTGDYQTLGGLILSRLGHVPRRGEKVELDRCILVVFTAAHGKIHWTRIIRKKPDE